MLPRKEKKFAGDTNLNLRILQTRKRLKIFSCIFLLSLICGGVFHQWILSSYGNWLSPSEPIQDVEIAVILDSYTSRIEAAAKLLKEEKVKAIYITFISRKALGEIIRKYDLPAEKVFWGGCRRMRNSFDQARSFRETVVVNGKLPYRRIVVMTNDFQMRRAVWSYQHVLRNESPGFEIKSHAISYPTYENSGKKWWEHEHLRRLVSTETQKTIYYWIYYGILGKEADGDVAFNDVFNINNTKYEYEQWVEHCNGDW